MDDREYELKFEIDPRDSGRLMAHPALADALAARGASRLVSTYFDTAGALLRARRISLRVRRSEQGTVHTLKRSGASIVDRDEWECVASAARPDAEWLRSTPLKALFRGRRAEELDPQFTVEVRRTTVPIRYNGAAIEGAFDQGEIRAKDRALPVSEFELELKEGSADTVLALARALVRDLPLVLSLSSKSERGYGLADASWGRPTKALALTLTDGMTLAQAFEAIVQACLHALLVNATLIPTAEALEATHKARIALRRLRGALNLFKPALRQGALDALTQEIKWIGDALGTARDADVFQSEVFDPAEADAAIPGAADLATIMRGLQGQAHADLQAALHSQRWRLLVLDLLAFSGDGVRKAERDAGYRPFVKDRLEHGRRALAKQADGLSGMTSDALHDIRKKAKMLRYNLDFFENAKKLGRGSKPFRRLQSDLQVLQETLGALHDHDAMRDHLRATMVDRDVPPGTPFVFWKSAAFAAGMIAALPPQGDALKRAAKAARRIAKAGVF
ncbi:CYTH and CHAD domain-containing protein [Beijerinckia sp. L45]|uniref:CYTH and CHAD domain-containing protein n=1 Tax=Beijerinckia sp. L45 TaxID=1641855 RepID=UPI00131ACAA9|nr:CYTH and CHAD domain-containing protein [Beijerinckia sp. L45]